jgi:hypothetical protein
MTRAASRKATEEAAAALAFLGSLPPHLPPPPPPPASNASLNEAAPKNDADVFLESLEELIKPTPKSPTYDSQVPQAETGVGSFDDLLEALDIDNLSDNGYFELVYLIMLVLLVHL